MTSRRLSISICAALACTVYVPASVSAPAVQKLLGLGGAKPDNASQAPGATLVERRSEIEQQLAAAQDAVERERAGKYPIPAGATPSQVTELGWLLGRIAAALQAQLDILQEISAARANRASAEEALAAWKGPDQPGPYTLTQVDRVLDQFDAEQVRLHSFRSVGELQQQELFRVETMLKASQTQERLAVEKAADGIATPLELARLRTRRLSEGLQLLRLQGELNTELTQATAARASLLERQAKAYSANYRFSEQELERVLKNLQAQQLTLDRRIEEANNARSRTVAEREQARRALASLAPARTVDEVRRHAELEARIESAGTILEALRTEQSALTTLRGLLPLATEAWRQRYASLSSPDPEERRAAEKALVASLARVDTLKSYATDLGTLSDTALQEQQRRVETLDENAPGRRFELSALEAARRSSDAVNEVEALAMRLATAQARWKKEYVEVSRERPAAERFVEFWVGVKDVSRSIWNFELFAVEDTVAVSPSARASARC
jgi:hypothetical protein